MCKAYPPSCRTRSSHLSEARTRIIIPASHSRKLRCREVKSLTRGQTMSIKGKSQDQTVSLLTCVWHLFHPFHCSLPNPNGRKAFTGATFVSEPLCSQHPGLGPGTEVVWSGRVRRGQRRAPCAQPRPVLSWGQVLIKLRGCENPMFSPPGSPRIPRAAGAGSNPEIVKQLLRKRWLLCIHQIRDSCPRFTRVCTSTMCPCDMCGFF